MERIVLNGALAILVVNWKPGHVVLMNEDILHRGIRSLKHMLLNMLMIWVLIHMYIHIMVVQIERLWLVASHSMVSKFMQGFLFALEYLHLIRLFKVHAERISDLLCTLLNIVNGQFVFIGLLRCFVPHLRMVRSCDVPELLRTIAAMVQLSLL